MANALSFNGAGSAQVPSFVWQWTPGAVEVYIKTTKPNQAFFTLVTTKTLFGKTAGLTAAVFWLDANGFVNLQFTGQVMYNNFSVVGAYVGTSNVCDGNWHQISYYNDGTNNHLFVDGAPQQLTQTSANPFVPNVQFPVSYTAGSINFGADTFNATPVAPAFTGLMTEIRIWQGGNPTFVLNPAFSLNYGVPVSAKAPQLALYWPFWTNQANNSLVDSVSQTAMTLTGGPSYVTNVGQVYDDLSEVLCNATMAPFNPFTAGTCGPAFSYIMQQIGMAAYTPTTFRSLYANSSYALNLSEWYTNIKGVTYPNTQAFTQADFGTVQTTLLAELTGGSTAWGFYNAATTNLVYVTDQISAAAANVFTVAFASEMSITTPAQSDAGQIVTAVAAIANAASKVYGPIMSAAIKTMWAVIGFGNSSTNSYPNFTQSMVIEAEANNLQTEVTTLCQNMVTGIQNSIGLILNNGGLLLTVNQRVSSGVGFTFAPNLNPQNNPDLNNLQDIYNTATLLLTQTILTAGYKFYIFNKNQYGNYNVTVNWNTEAPLFYFGWGQGLNPFAHTLSFGGQAMIAWYETDGNNGWPAYTTPTQPVANLLTNAATNLNNQTFTTAELLTWNFPQSTVC